MIRNPFVLNGYIGKEYFCDREYEVRKSLEYVSNGVNVTLVPPRRVGKTGLMEHLFHHEEVEGMVAIPKAIEDILDENQVAYEALLFQIPSRQKALLSAICAEGKAFSITSTAFVRKHSLSSSSSVQSAIRGLLEKEPVTSENGAYEVYDKFLAMWIFR